MEALVDAFAKDRPRWSRTLLITVMAMFLLTFTATWFPGGRDWFYILQPVSAFLFFIERLLHSWPMRNESVVSDAARYGHAA